MKKKLKTYLFRPLFLAGFCLGLGSFVQSCRPNDVIYDYSIRETHTEKDLPVLQNAEIPKELNLQDIIEIAITRNLDVEVKKMEWEVQHERATGEKLKMLPTLIFNGEHSLRNTKPTVIDVTATAATPTQSTSRRVNRFDLTAAWNLVDFGVSYYRSRQEKKRADGLGYQYVRSEQNLILDVNKAYWKAYAAKKAMDGAVSLMGLVRDMERKYQKQASYRNIPQSVGLEAENKLVNLELQLTRFETDFANARTELAALMAVSPCTPFDIVFDEQIHLPEIKDICCFEETALLQRPELYSTDLEERIQRDEVRIAIISMFPPLVPFAGYNQDQDPFLVHHHWIIFGARVTWNLLSIPQRYWDTRVARERIKLTHASRLALSMGIIAQLHLAYNKYQEAVSRLQLVNRIADVKNGLLYISRKSYEYGEGDETIVLGFQADSLIAEIEAYKAYGDARVALEQMSNSMGIPGYFLDDKEESVCCDLQQ